MFYGLNNCSMSLTEKMIRDAFLMNNETALKIMKVKVFFCVNGKIPLCCLVSEEMYIAFAPLFF